MRFFQLTIATAIIICSTWWWSQRDQTTGHTQRDSGVIATAVQNVAPAPARLPIEMFVALIGNDPATRIASLAAITQNWNVGDIPMLIESARFAANPQTTLAILQTMKSQTGQDLGGDLDDWYRWVWNQDIDVHPNYATFKKTLYSQIDPRFAEYFDDSRPNTIRLDEIRWGGVRRDGIPPLKNPETIPVSQAGYLADSDIVFGVEFGGQSRAYPKRILAWHEMVKDVVGGRSINGVYCTLCGSMIVYDTKLDGKHYELGTSGFLYRSNKLMYDHETKSMWSTLEGSPVVGPLVGQGIELEPLYVVTTTWGQWKSLHPDTDVLSRNTGHRRDYGEGVAYRDYFATDDLMFIVPKLDNRLKNKDEVLIVRDTKTEPIAIAAEFLSNHRIHPITLGSRRLVVLTDESGANRVYEVGDVTIDRWVDAMHVSSADAETFTVTEDGLVSDQGRTLARAAAHRAFWFGWSAAFPGTKLIQ